MTVAPRIKLTTLNAKIDRTSLSINDHEKGSEAYSSIKTSMWVKKHNSVKYHIIHEFAVGSVYKSRKSIETTTRTYSQRFTYDTVSKGMDFSTN